MHQWIQNDVNLHSEDSVASVSVDSVDICICSIPGLSQVFIISAFALSQSVIVARSKVDLRSGQPGFALTLSSITSRDISTTGRNKTKSSSTRYEWVREHGWKVHD